MSGVTGFTHRLSACPMRDPRGIAPPRVSMGRQRRTSFAVCCSVLDSLRGDGGSSCRENSWRSHHRGCVRSFISTTTSSTRRGFRRPRWCPRRPTRRRPMRRRPRRQGTTPLRRRRRRCRWRPGLTSGRVSACGAGALRGPGGRVSADELRDSVHTHEGECLDSGPRGARRTRAVGPRVLSQHRGVERAGRGRGRGALSPRKSPDDPRGALSRATTRSTRTSSARPSICATGRCSARRPCVATSRRSSICTRRRGTSWPR